MAELKNRVKSALGEARMLILGAQVLLGFQYRAVFEKGFDTLPLWSQTFKLSSLGLMLVAVGLLIAPTAYHRIVERGEDTEELHSFTSKVMLWALLPFALALGLDLFVASEQIIGRKWAVAVGFLTLSAALFFWYLLEFYRRRAREDQSTPAGRHTSLAAHAAEARITAGVAAGGPIEGSAATANDAQGARSAAGDVTAGEALPGEAMMDGRTMNNPKAGEGAVPGRRPDEGSGARPDEQGGGASVGQGDGSGGGKGGATISDKIDHVLMEARVVLPGAQALLGFQFVAVLTESFTQLPAGAKYVHLLSLLMVALTIVLLMTPAAYHRIVERGEETEHFHRFASRFIVAAMVPLALGLSGDIYVVVRKVTDSQVLSIVAGLVALAMFWELWFGLTLYRRTQRRFAD
jgi:hypothetical protein